MYKKQLLQEVVAIWCQWRPNKRFADTRRPHPQNEIVGGTCHAHPASHLAAAGLPRHQGGGWSLIPACLRLSLVTSAPGVGHGHQTENMTKSAI